MIGGQHFSSLDRKENFLKKIITPDFTYNVRDVGKKQADIFSVLMPQFRITQMFGKLPFFDGRIQVALIYQRKNNKQT